uniref:Uncharacterized protein n=1 Tax=Anser cygnoides TaxID=8845 RepID=A0A8B9EGT8_ANSCY
MQRRREQRPARHERPWCHPRCQGAEGTPAPPGDPRPHPVPVQALTWAVPGPFPSCPHGRRPRCHVLVGAVGLVRAGGCGRKAGGSGRGSGTGQCGGPTAPTFPQRPAGCAAAPRPLGEAQVGVEHAVCHAAPAAPRVLCCHKGEVRPALAEAEVGCEMWQMGPARHGRRDRPPAVAPAPPARPLPRPESRHGPLGARRLSGSGFWGHGQSRGGPKFLVLGESLLLLLLCPDIHLSILQSALLQEMRRVTASFRGAKEESAEPKLQQLPPSLQQGDGAHPAGHVVTGGDTTLAEWDLPRSTGKKCPQGLGTWGQQRVPCTMTLQGWDMEKLAGGNRRASGRAGGTWDKCPGTNAHHKCPGGGWRDTGVPALPRSPWGVMRCRSSRCHPEPPSGAIRANASTPAMLRPPAWGCTASPGPAQGIWVSLSPPSPRAQPHTAVHPGDRDGSRGVGGDVLAVLGPRGGGRSPRPCLAGPICHSSQPTSASVSAGLTSPLHPETGDRQAAGPPHRAGWEPAGIGTCPAPSRMAQSVLYADLRFAKGPGGRGTASQALEAALGMDEAESPYENMASGPAPTGPAAEGTLESPGESPNGDRAPREALLWAVGGASGCSPSPLGEMRRPRRAACATLLPPQGWPGEAGGGGG